MEAFLARHRVPGAAVAVTDGGRLVYARGFGYADLATREPVTPRSLFRIASLSKPITSTAILALAREGRLSLEDKVFSLLDQYSEARQGKDYDKRQDAITLRELLEHRGGWDRDQSFDAMFESVRFAEEEGVPPPAAPDTVIRAMLRRPLDFDPGERYAYSNYGYCLLGRVIEKVTGVAYEAYVREHVLAGLGSRDMRLGRTRLEERQPGEVRYYQPGWARSVFAGDLGEQVPWPYGGWNLEAMDSHGGWIASAVDLARFASAFDHLERSNILAPEDLETLYARPPGLAGHEASGEPTEVYYSLGWMNRVIGDGEVNHWHTGSLSGTATILIRRHDGRNFVALLNSRSSPQAGHLGREIDHLLHEAADEVEHWPKHDLFDDL
jgi:N-acyl-D-amino-acid deacylase